MVSNPGQVAKKVRKQPRQINKKFLFYSVLAIAILTAFTYRSSLRNEFMNWDDEAWSFALPFSSLDT